MAITKTDIKLKESERLTDTNDGGGRMTAVEVVDGQVNNLFNDISRLDRTIGRVSMRKAFIAVDTVQQDVYAGAHLIVTNPPDDPGVHTTIFTTNDDDDERSNAQSRVESYTVAGPVSRMRLYDRHVSGQKTLQMFQFPSDPLPEVGEVYALSKGENTINETVQFFRIQKLAEELITFISSRVGPYDVRVINLTIDVTLTSDFEGYVPAPSDDEIEAQYAIDDVDRPLVRQTSVADAARYFGVTPIDVSVTANDFSVECSSIFSPLVPSTQAESPIVDVAANEPSAKKFILSLKRSHTFPSTISAGSELKLGHEISVGSVDLEFFTNGSLLGTSTDNGDGTASSETIGGITIDYTNGLIKFSNFIGIVGIKVDVTFKRFADVFETNNSKQIPITIQNRQLSYVDFIRPIPHPETLSVSYRSLGKWYRMTDDGLGSLVPEIANTGAGSINYFTGSASITLPFEPDVDSSIIFQWGTAANYADRSGDILSFNPGALLKTVKPGIVPSSLTVSWVSGAVNKSATDDGLGNLTGDATGKVIYSTGQIYIEPTDYPDPNAQYVLDYDNAVEVVETFNPTKDGNGFIPITLAQQPIKPGSVRVNWNTVRDATISEQVGA